MMERRKKSGLALKPSILELCDENLERSGSSSRNEFVEKAVEFYAGYLSAERASFFFEELFRSFSDRKKR